MNLQITRIRHRWSEAPGFTLTRPHGAGEYIFLHFLTPVTLTVFHQVYQAQPGAVIIISPNTPHEFYSEGRLFHDWMHLTGPVEQAMQAFGLATDTLYQPNIEAAISEIAAFLEWQFFSRQPYWDELQNAKLAELMIRIQHEVNSNRIKTSTEMYERLCYLRAEMQEHPEQNWTITKMTDMIHLSSSRMHALYKSTFGIAPLNDLILIRIEKAKQLLLQGLSVNDTAAALGYMNVFHFIRQFKDNTGTTPKKFAMQKN